MSDRIDDISKEINQKFKHHCWNCGYHTNNKPDLVRHQKTLKHNKNIDNENFQYHCWPCNFHANYQSKLLDHENTIKHKKRTYKNPNIVILSNIILIFINVCKICETQFTYESEDNLCWECILNNIDEMIKYEKCKNTKKFCYKDNCLYCYNRSFLSNPKYIYLDIEYGIDPRQISKQDNNLFNFLCLCSHKFASRLNNIHRNNWCPYCSSPPQKLCENKEKCKQCFNNSFASDPRSKYWSSKNGISPRFVFKHTRERYLFDCNKCFHEFDQIPSCIIDNNGWCKYCAHRALCEDIDGCEFCHNNSFASHPMSKYFSSKNNTTPREVFLNSSKKYIFDCPTCDNEFKAKLYNINNGRWCRYCKNKTETKFKEWFEKEFSNYELEHQPSFNWCKNVKKLPFDFGIIIFNLIIEIDGIQHFKQVSNWKSPELTQQRDIYKMKQAIKNNYSIIRISQEDIWYDKYNWQKEITEYIKKYDTPQVIYLSKNKDLYNEHKQLMFINNLLDNLILDEVIINIINKYL